MASWLCNANGTGCVKVGNGLLNMSPTELVSLVAESKRLAVSNSAPTRSERAVSSSSKSDGSKNSSSSSSASASVSTRLNAQFGI